LAYDAAAMELFFNPRSVVIVGASRKTGPGSFNILENLLAYGYRGRVYAVNPRASDILGVKCYPRAQDLPEAPDLAVVTVPRELLPEVVRDCCTRGVRLFIFVPQGLGEADEVGAAIQSEVLETLRRHGARAVGPNTLGTINALDGFMSSFMGLTRNADPFPCGLICQTGLFLATDLGQTTSLGKGIDVGNQADIGFPDALRHLAEDPRVKVIAMHMEGLRPGEGRLFLEVAREAVARKPVLVYKTARSATGAEAAGSHTGSLAGSHEVYVAAFEEAGIIQLKDVDDLDDTIKAFVFLPPMRGRRVAILSISGGGGIMAADACDDHGLRLAEFSPETRARLQEMFPSWMTVSNPLDVWPAAIGKEYDPVFATCLDIVAADPNVDALVCIGGSMGGGVDIGDFVVEGARRWGKPVTWWLYGKRAAAIAAEVESSRCVPVYPSADRAVRALGHLATYYLDVLGRRKEAPVRPVGLPRVERGPGLPDAAAGTNGPGLRARRATVRAMGAEAFDLLRSYGIPVARWAVASSPQAAAAAAASLGLPVVVKAVGGNVLHKSELGAVKLGLATPEAVLEAAEDVLRRVAGEGSEVRLLVQEFLPGGQEVILGAKHDPHFGPTVLFGLGGIFTEVLRDVAIGLAPLTTDRAHGLMAKTKGYAVLAGARSRGRSDLEALADTLVRLSWLVADHPEIVELDLNPVKVFAAGQGCVAVDARVLVRSDA